MKTEKVIHPRSSSPSLR